MIDYTNRLILDCTLRDGGYVNNWEFDTQTALAVRDALYDSGIRYIELGIMGNGGVPGKCTKFDHFDQVRPLLAGRKTDCHYCIMFTQAEYASSGMVLPPCGPDTVDIIRLAYFKAEKDAALATAQEMKEKGYTAFLQAMATFMYSDKELAAMLEQINAMQPDAFYMVDSFSTMYNENVRHMQQFVLERLDENILFGFHAHNNIQMAYSNIITFVNYPTERPLMMDGSIYGMGRGAGNVPVELLMEYFNKNLGAQYKTEIVLDAFARYIEPIFRQNYWGYSMPYLLTASKNCNSVYGWYLGRKNITGLLDINKILDRIPEQAKYTLMRDVIDPIISQYLEENPHE